MTERHTVAIIVRPEDQPASLTIAALKAYGWSLWHLAVAEAETPNDAVARVMIRDFAWHNEEPT